MSDLLKNLQSELERELIKFNAAKDAIRDLRIAISALEDAHAATEPTAGNETKREKGHLKRAIWDCLHEGIGRVSLIHEALTRRGILTSTSSISNAINRLQHQKLVQYDSATETWVCRDTENTKGSVEKSTEPLMNSTIESSPPAMESASK